MSPGQCRMEHERAVSRVVGFTSGQVDSFSRYCPPAAWVESIAPDGVVLPYTDLPLDDDLVGETAYLNMIHRAKKYVYITTPIPHHRQ